LLVLMESVAVWHQWKLGE